MSSNGLLNEKNAANRLEKSIRQEPLSNSYTVEREIGRGKFAVVKLVKEKSSGKHFAAKFIRKRRKGKNSRNEILHEVVVMEMALSHSRLIHMVEVFETPHDIIVVMEYAAGGELYHHCVLEENIKEKDVVRLMRQIIDGLSFLHERDIVHLDIKPSNILLTKAIHGDIKLCDFGFARLVNSGVDVREILGTPDMCAPEILGYEPISTATDMWSIGVLAYIMLTGHSPFLGESKQETFLNISQVNLEFPEDLFENITPLAKDFIESLLVKDPQNRPSCKDCLNHPWLQQDLLSVNQPLPQVGSPLGCRRSLPDVNGKIIVDETVAKKYKLDDSHSKCKLDEIHSKCKLDENHSKCITCPALIESVLVR